MLISVHGQNMCTKVPDVQVLDGEVSFIWRCSYEVTLNTEPEAVVELNAAELAKTLWVWFYAQFYHK